MLVLAVDVGDAVVVVEIDDEAALAIADSTISVRLMMKR